MQRLSTFDQLLSLGFILYLTVHFTLLTPLIHYLCLCPQADAKQVCSCTCAKCTARKADASGTHLLDSDSVKNPYKACAIPGYAGVMQSRPFKIPGISVETVSCKCSKETKSVATDLKPFIPELIFVAFIAPAAFKFILETLVWRLEVFLPPPARAG